MNSYRGMLEEARRHLTRAEVELETEEYEESCMRARDAAEQALLAYLVSKGQSFEEEEGNDLLDLLRQAQAHDPTFASLEPILKDLNRFRAPEKAKPREIRTAWGTVPDEQEATLAVRKARQVLTFVEGKLGP